MTPRRRWIPPIIVVAVIGAGALVSAAQAQVDLPDRSPAQVLALAEQADVRTFSGTVETRSDLGLPDVSMGREGGADALALLTSDHRLRVWVDGPKRQRVQIMDQLAETNMIHNGRDLWIYESRDNTATHVQLPQSTSMPERHPSSLTPDQLAAGLLAAVDDSTEVSVGSDSKVAGRATYDLRLRPKVSGSLIEQVSVAVDAETGLPLRVRIDAVGHQPALEVAYTSLTLARPDGSTFDFTPPADAEVEEITVPAGGDERGGWHDGQTPDGVQVLGEGWTSVLEMPARTPAGQLPPELAGALQPIEGGSVLRTALLTVLLTDDGRLLVGAVTPEVLQEAARR